MKISNFILLTVIILAGLASCKKDSSDKPTSLEGRWVGTYLNEASGNSFYYSFNIKPGGVIEEINSSGQTIGVGTWEMQNDILSAEYKWSNGSKYSVLAAFYRKEGKLLGDWGYGNSATNGGTWQMQKDK